jgi:hypothetical protein
MQKEQAEVGEHGRLVFRLEKLTNSRLKCSRGCVETTLGAIVVIHESDMSTYSPQVIDAIIENDA